jgi:hypothetical protein
MGKGDTHTKKHSKNHFVKYDLVIAKKEEGEFYAKVMGILNGNRLKVKDNKGDEMQVGIRGNFFYGSKKENLNFPDLERHEYWVLVQPGISKNQYFLKHIYNDSDREKLQNKGELSYTHVQYNTIETNNNDPVEEEEGPDEDWLDNL